MDVKPPQHTIEYYKSEVVKKEEIIEKLFEEVDELKEHNKVIEKLKNETKSLAQDNNKKDQEIESLKASHTKAIDHIKYLEKLLQDMQNKENNWKKREKDWIKQHKKLDELRTHLAKSLEEK